MNPNDDEAFITRTLSAIRAESADAQDARLEAAMRSVPRPSAAPGRSRRKSFGGWLGHGLTAVAAGLIGATVAFALSRSGEAAPSEAPFALDGQVRGDGARSPIVITTDAEGRPTEIARRGENADTPRTGQRVLFRSGMVIRIEHYRDGLLDGPVLEFDGLGRLVSQRTYSEGVERGPYIELGPDGKVHKSGLR